jgi:AIPR protein
MPGLTEEEHALIEAQTVPFYVGNRTRSTALLAWFIAHVMREDPDAVEDAICDGGGDKGIDAIVFDEDANELFVLQAKHRRQAATAQGDADLRSFSGVAAYFSGADGIQSLLDSAPNEELTNLVGRLDLARRLEESAPQVRLIFVTNAERDAAGVDYLATVADHSPTLELWDGPRLVEIAHRTERPDLLPGEYTLSSAGIISKALSDETRMAVAMIPAMELIRLPGIENLTIFDLNVRLGLGNTKINRELRQTIRTRTEHPLFPAYHNGLTLLTSGLEHDGEDLLLDGVGVVNGCQSLLSLWREREHLSPDLILIVKIIELDQRADLADKVTYRSNNQNPVNMRDQRANDRIQRDLQNEVQQRYGDALFYDIRRGQPSGDAASQLDNQLAAQLLMAIWIGEPWNAVPQGQTL